MNKKFAMVTGASTGIGRAISIELSKHGYFVALVGRSEMGLVETQNQLIDGESNGGIFTCDLSQIDQIEKLIEKIKEKTQQVDAIVNVAAIWHGDGEVYAGIDFDTFDKQLILDTYTVGLTAPTLLIHGLMPLVPINGKVVNISGTFENGAKGWLPYFVSKKGIEDLTVGLAEELKERGVQVNCVSPSDTATEAYQKYFPQYMDEAIEPSKIAEEVVYLCSGAANDITGKVFVMKKDSEPSEGYHT